MPGFQACFALRQFSETIVPRVSRVPLCYRQSAKRKGLWEGQRPRCPIRRRTGNEDVAPPVRLNPARSTTKWGCALRVVKRRPFLYDSVVKDLISACRTCISACHFQSAKHILNASEACNFRTCISACKFQSAKHTFKASVACNGREVLRGTPGRRHGISAIEAADCLGNREPTIHWKVSRTSAACRVGSRKHLSPSAMRSEPVGRIPGVEVTLRLAGITCPLKS